MKLGKNEYYTGIIEGHSEFNVIGTLPLMSEKETDMIRNSLKSNHIVFEWGSGGSTLYFPQFVDKYYSVESQFHWFVLIRNTLITNNSIFTNTRIYYRPQDKTYDFGDMEYKKEWYKT